MGGEGVADFVGKAFGDFAPCGFFLGADEFGDVVEHEHETFAVFGGQADGFAQQDAAAVLGGVGKLNGVGAVFAGNQGVD